MSVGFVMLCHTALDRAAETARHWATRDSPVVIHVDKRVDRAAYDGLVSALSDLGNVRFSARFTCEWGTWGIVAATQAASTVMLREFPAVRHVFLASGSCLPLRPVQDLKAYLASRPRVDFIESVTTEDVGWTIGGLDVERFTLRFPFSWRKSRRLFDRYVKFQRRIGYKRQVPDGLVPHLGSQWWCLTRATLSAILDSPNRAEIDRYFKKVWIPDESYFQTLVRQYSSTVESRSLTLSKFDFQGKPHIFYDDHLQLLRRSDCFVARKIWPQADKIYQTFLHGDAASQATAEPNRTPARSIGCFPRPSNAGSRGGPACTCKAGCRAKITKMAAQPRPIRCSKALPNCSRIMRPGSARLPEPASTVTCSPLGGLNLPAASRYSTALCRTAPSCATINPKAF